MSKAILPPPGPPGSTKPAVPLAPLKTHATRDLSLSPGNVGRLPAEAADAVQADYGDVSPEKPADPGPTQSPPAPMELHPHLAERERRKKG